MTGRYVQGGKVVVVSLYFGSLGDPVAESHEEVHDLVDDAQRGMQAPIGIRHTGERNVHRLRAQALLALGGGEGLEAYREGGLDLPGSPVRGPANLTTFLGREIPNALLYLGELGRAAQIPH